MDANLAQLEVRTKSGAIRYGRFAAFGLGALLLAGAAFFIYRRTSKPTLKDRLNELSLDNLRTLTERLARGRDDPPAE